MNQVDLILKKRNGGELSDGELEFFVNGFVDGSIPDYQVSALLMAIYFQGMTTVETAALTRIMRDSGTVLSHPNFKGSVADKHSTGGVGDKVSLVLAPLAASAGLIVPMISGRALGHTGGTLDKLEAIPGFRIDLSQKEIDTQLEKIGVAMVGQTEDLCPADRKIYALRDATATVQSIPLITASILSKKLAEGLDGLILDVKAGSGAMFEDEQKSQELAKMLVKTASEFDLNTSALITSMQQPLGNAVGNWLETREAIQTLKGEGPLDLVELTLALCSEMLLACGKSETRAAALQFLRDKLESGAAYETFCHLVEMQNGKLDVVENPNAYPTAKTSVEIKAERDGFVSEIYCRRIGEISMAIGAGRRSMDDEIDYTAGIMLHKKVGDSVRNGDVMAVAYSNDKGLLEQNRTKLLNAFTLSEAGPESTPLIQKRIDINGEQAWK